MKSSLLEEIQEQKESANVVYDFDSQIYLSAYRFKDTDDIELIYADCWMRLKSIESELWKQYQIDKTIIALTSKKNYRHDLTKKWKANRKPKPESEMTDKQLEAHRATLKLKTLVSATKRLFSERMTKSSNYRVIVNNQLEADDIFIYLTNQKGYIGVTIDSDCLLQTTSECFNPNKWEWSKPNSYTDICRHILFTSIQGGHNSSGLGVKGYGVAKANKFLDSGFTFDDYVNLFETNEDMLMNVRVSSCCQAISTDTVKLLEVTDIAEMIDEVNDTGEDVF